MSGGKYIPKDIASLYEVHDFKHAAAILSNEFPDQFDDICAALREFRFCEEDVVASGGK